MPLLLFWVEFLSKYQHPNSLKGTLSHSCSLWLFGNIPHFLAGTIRWMWRRDRRVQPSFSLNCWHSKEGPALDQLLLLKIVWQSRFFYFEVLKEKVNFKLSCSLQALIFKVLLTVLPQLWNFTNSIYAFYIHIQTSILYVDRHLYVHIDIYNLFSECIQMRKARQD